MNQVVSIIVPCYNQAKYLDEALQSVLDQTYIYWECIVVNDGSLDFTEKIAKKWVEKDSRFHYIYQENKGVSAARNHAISLTRNDYILNLDADDCFEPTFIEKAVQILNENETVGVVGCWYKVFENKKTDNTVIKPLGGEVENFLFKNNGLGNSMYRKKCWEIVSGYDEKMIKGYEDWDFWIGILSNQWIMYIIEEVLFNYRVKPISRHIIAKTYFDFELRKYIFLKHKEVFLKNYELFSLQLIAENSKMRSENKFIKSSINYRIGTIVLNPLRIFNVIKNKLL